MCFIHQTILLIAGRGDRIGALTESRPKCLLEIDGTSILERSLHTLSISGVSKTILVIGYKGEQIQHLIGDRHEEMKIEYVINPRYAETNTAYSLWLARGYLSSESLILEGDILFDEEILSHILSCSGGESTWAAVPVTPQRNEGVLLSRNSIGNISGLKVVRHPQDRNTELQFKCAGIQFLTADNAQALAFRLDETIQRGEIQKYADLVLAETLDTHPMILCSLEGMRWAEVDDIDDYQSAQQMFNATTNSIHSEKTLPSRFNE